MADYFVRSGGSDGNSGADWTNAKQTIAGALSAATSTGDRVILAYNDLHSTDTALASDTTYTIGAAIGIIAASNDGGTAFTPTPMGDSYFIGNASTARAITITGTYGYYVYGLSFLITQTLGKALNIATGAASTRFDSCRFKITNTSSSSAIYIGISTTGTEQHCSMYNCSMYFGSTSGRLYINASCEFIGLTIDSGGSAPSPFIGSVTSSAKAWATFSGCDLSHVTGTLVGDQTNGNKLVTFKQCKFGSGVTVMAAQTEEAGAEVFVYDCASGDTHYQFGHYTTTGTLVADATVYADDGAEYNTGGSKHSWKIVTTGICQWRFPYRSPWISVYNEGTGAITPYLEAASTTSGLNESDIWSEWLVKSTSGYPISTLDQSDRGGVAASTTDQAAGSATWTGISETAYKLAPSSSFTPAEIGDIAARACCALTSATIYVDPQIRGLS